MAFVQLVSQRLTDGIISIHPEPPKSIQIQTGYSFHIDYAENNTLATATLQQKAFCPADEQMFNIKITIAGQFKCEKVLTEDDKREAHVMMYTQLHPYVQSFISHISVSAGLPPPADPRRPDSPRIYSN